MSINLSKSLWKLLLKNKKYFYFFAELVVFYVTQYQWGTQKISEGGAKFRHNHVTSKISFR